MVCKIWNGLMTEGTQHVNDSSLNKINSKHRNFSRDCLQEYHHHHVSHGLVSWGEQCSAVHIGPICQGMWVFGEALSVYIFLVKSVAKVIIKKKILVSVDLNHR